MSEVIQLFPELPGDVKEGDLVWLPRFAAFGTIMTIRRSGHAAIAMRGRTVALHLIRDRHEIHTQIEDAHQAADPSPA
jgi:hypothetical protein